MRCGFTIAFCLSFRDVEELLAERGIIVSYETIRQKLFRCHVNHFLRPDSPNWKKFERKRIYYGATYIESQLCEREVAVLGGGNSAGQAGVFLSQSARKFYMLVRSRVKEHYVAVFDPEVAENPAIELHYNTEIVALHGDDHVQRLEWQNKKTGETSAHISSISSS
jgi:thioredoxin reductase (NADPH)